MGRHAGGVHEKDRWVFDAGHLVATMTHRRTYPDGGRARVYRHQMLSISVVVYCMPR